MKILLIFLVSQTVVQLAGATREKFKGDTYTDAELRAVSELKKRIDNELHEDWMHDNKFYVRFLRVKHMNVNAAEQMIRDAVKWRKSENIDNILSEDFSWWERTYPFYFMHDYDGRPGIAAGVGQMNFRRWILANKAHEVIRYIYYGLEKGTQYGIKYVNETGIEYNHGNLLFNMAGFDMRNHACNTCKQIFFKLGKIYENCYPLLGLRMTVINAPRLFVQGLSSAKPFVSKFTQSAITLYGFNKAEYSREILKLYPPENITPEFGGTLRLTRASSKSEPVIKTHPSHSSTTTGTDRNNPAEFHAGQKDEIFSIPGFNDIQKNINSIIAGTNKGGVQSAETYLASIFGTQSYENSSKTAIGSIRSDKKQRNSATTEINIGSDAHSISTTTENANTKQSDQTEITYENIAQDKSSTNSSTDLNDSTQTSSTAEIGSTKSDKNEQNSATTEINIGSNSQSDAYSIATTTDQTEITHENITPDKSSKNSSTDLNDSAQNSSIAAIDTDLN